MSHIFEFLLILSLIPIIDSLTPSPGETQQPARQPAPVATFPGSAACFILAILCALSVLCAFALIAFAFKSL